MKRSVFCLRTSYSRAVSSLPCSPSLQVALRKKVQVFYFLELYYTNTNLLLLLYQMSQLHSSCVCSLENVNHRFKIKFLNDKSLTAPLPAQILKAGPLDPMLVEVLEVAKVILSANEAIDSRG